MSILLNIKLQFSGVHPDLIILFADSIRSLCFTFCQIGI